MAGLDKRYSNISLPLLAEVLGRYARPQHPEKTLEELTKLIEQLARSEARPPRTPRQRSVTSERLLGPERVGELLERYAAGESANALGREFGIAQPSVMRLVRRHGVIPHRRLPSEAEIQQAVELYLSGLSLQQVANETGYSKSTIRRALLGAGVRLRRSKLD